MKDIKAVVEKMTRNCLKMIGNTANSLLCPLHSIQFSPLVFLPLWTNWTKLVSDRLSARTFPAGMYYFQTWHYLDFMQVIPNIF